MQKYDELLKHICIENIGYNLLTKTKLKYHLSRIWILMKDYSQVQNVTCVKVCITIIYNFIEPMKLRTINLKKHVAFKLF